MKTNKTTIFGMMLLVVAMLCAAGCTKPDEPNNGGNDNGGSGGNGGGGGNNNGGVELVGTYNGHEYIDLGLPSGTLWATCNVGAYSPEDYGSYFAWGETTTKSSYSYNNYKYGRQDNNGNYHFTKYNTFPEYGPVDNLSTLQAVDDAATAKWGNGWRIPTKTEWEELYNHTMATWTSQNGVKGLCFTASNGGSIFLPAGGRYYLADLISHTADYWTNELDTSQSICALMFRYSNGNCHISDISREVGAPIRPVH